MYVEAFIIKKYPIELTVYYIFRTLLRIICLLTDSGPSLENKVRLKSLIKSNPMNNLIKKIRLDNVVFYFRGSDYVEFLTITSPVYDKQWAAFVLNSVNKLIPNTFIDVGAHLGTFALRVGRMLPSTIVIAVEPSPSTTYLLEKAVADNGLSNVKVLNKAAYSYSGNRVKLHFSEHSTGNTICNTHPKKPKATLAKYVEVQTIALDDIIRDYKVRKPIVLKIDAEGAEWDILIGAEKLLQECDECFLEVHKPAKQTEKCYCVCEVCSYLREKGFSIKTILFERKLHGVHGVKNKIG
jgi:FkbM family methyltransferase